MQRCSRSRPDCTRGTRTKQTMAGCTLSRFLRRPLLAISLEPTRLLWLAPFVHPRATVGCVPRLERTKGSREEREVIAVVLAFSSPGPDSLAGSSPVDSMSARKATPTRSAGRNLQPRLEASSALVRRRRHPQAPTRDSSRVRGTVRGSCCSGESIRGDGPFARSPSRWFPCSSSSSPLPSPPSAASSLHASHPA